MTRCHSAQVNSTRELCLPCPSGHLVLDCQVVGWLASCRQLSVGLAWGPLFRLPSLPPAQGESWQHLPQPKAQPW